MSDTHPKVDAYLSKQTTWREELEALRAILLETPLTEDFKWGSPCYAFEGSNVAILWTLKDHCGLGFFKGALMKDPKGVLVAPGENSRSARKIVFADAADIIARKALIKAYVREAIAVEKAGLSVTFEKDDLAYPQELTDRLAKDAPLKAAFEALTPGRRRGYLLHFGQGKQAKTRAARIDKHAPRILQGKGMHDR